MNLQKAFREFLKDLDRLKKKEGFEYAVIGGIAVGLWGHIRATKDIDILADIDPDRIDSASRYFESRGYGVEIRRGGISDDVLLMLRLRIPEKKGGGIIADILIVTRSWEREILRNRKRIPIGKEKINVVSPEDLIAMKLRSGSPLDEMDAREIFLINRERIDGEYLSIRAKQLGVNKKLSRLLKEITH